MTVLIYKLSNPICSKFYVGSTACDLKQRLSKHQNKSHEAPNRRLYKYINENGGFKQWNMTLLETIESDCRLTRNKTEQFWIDELNAELNSVRCLG